MFAKSTLCKRDKVNKPPSIQMTGEGVTNLPPGLFFFLHLFSKYQFTIEVESLLNVTRTRSRKF